MDNCSEPAEPSYGSSACRACASRSIPVSVARVGETGVVVRISGTPEVKKFLSDLGFTIGTTISTVSDTKGNKILSIRGSKIAIDSGMASRIMFCPE